MKTKTVITDIPNAIILAAGLGMRMIPINTDTPKALVKVEEVSLIERLILQLQEAGVEDITIVVGYLKEQLTYLEEKYSVQLVMNDRYADKNNLHSLALVSNKIVNSYILPCDIWSEINPFMINTDTSWYLMYNERQDNLGKEYKPFWNSMTGIAYISRKDSEFIKERLLSASINDIFNESFWEEILYEDRQFILPVRTIEKSLLFQINTYEDLRELDNQSNHLKSEVIDLICEVLNVTSEMITDIKALKKGMTNRSFLFTCNEKKYIMRIPGEGTDQLINRKQEAEVYNVIADMGISDPLVYINPQNGYKITEFLSQTRSCDLSNKNDVVSCMKKLRYFHSLELSVEHEFDLWEQLEFYEQLKNGIPSCYESYSETKSQIFALKDFIEQHVKKKVLCHIDSVSDNFLIREDSQSIYLIDWEYSGMQDPHVDIAMFCIYALYDKEKIDQVIDIYFEGDVTEVIKMKIYAYIAACGLLWSNWCEYKKKLGVDFGDYAKAQYQYALDYSKIVLKYLNGASQIKE